MESLSIALEDAIGLLLGFSYLQIFGSVVVGVSLYLAIKLWNGQIKLWGRAAGANQKNGRFFEESWHQLIYSLQPSELALSRNNHHMRLLAVQVSRFRTRHLLVSADEADGEGEEADDADDNDEDEDQEDEVEDSGSQEIEPLDTAVWFDSLECLVEAVPYSSLHRSVPLVGDILLTVLMPNEDLLIAYLLNLVSPTLVLLYERQTTNAAEQSLICRELTRWLTGLSEGGGGNSTKTNTAYPKALLWFLLEFDFFGKLAQELAQLQIPAPLLTVARREHADKVAFFYAATATAHGLRADRDVAWVRYHLLGLFEQNFGIFELLLRRQDFEAVARMERPAREELGEPLIPIPRRIAD